MRILVTGGAGYIGTSLIPFLLQDGNEVTVLDNLLHGADAILPFFRDSNFKFIKGDVRDSALVQKSMEGMDGVVHLAAIVGMPACKANPQDATSVNVDGSLNVRKAALRQRIVYASTVSSYGRFEGGICDESAPLKPLGLYGETKAEAERWLLSYPGTTALRFATLFGISPRMRLDLLVNDFTYQSVKTGSMVVYQADAVRAVVHVLDAVAAIRLALFDESMAGKVYNVVGHNLTKRAICEAVGSETGAYFHYAEVGEDGDGRNAAVDGSKLRSTTNWQSKHALEEGIHEMARAFAALKVRNSYANA